MESLAGQLRFKTLIITLSVEVPLSWVLTLRAFSLPLCLCTGRDSSTNAWTGIGLALSDEEGEKFLGISTSFKRRTGTKS